MSIAHTKVTGLDESRLVALIEPVLLEHGVEGVELLWKTDAMGWVLTINVEKPGTTVPGQGITIELCSEISREISALLDREDLIPHAYRLEIGSAGLERALYSRADYERYAGQLAKLKLREPLGDQRVLRGKISFEQTSDLVHVETEQGRVSTSFDTIASARLIFDWNSPSVLGGAKAKSPKPRSSERDRRNRASKRKR